MTKHRRLTAASLALAWLAMLVVLGLLNLVDWNYDLAVAWRVLFAFLGLLSTVLLAVSIIVLSDGLPVEQAFPRGRRARRILPMVVIAIASVCTFLLAGLYGWVSAYANSSGEAAYPYTGPHHSSPWTVWMVSSAVLLLFGILLMWRPLLACSGIIAVLFAGFVSIAAVDEVRPSFAALAWSIVSIPSVAGVLIALGRERASRLNREGNNAAAPSRERGIVGSGG